MGLGPTPFVSAFKDLPVNTLRYQTSQAGLPIQIVYGTNRVTPNLLAFAGYHSPPNGKGSKGGGGGGGGGKKNGNYWVWVDFGICQGPLPDAFTGTGTFNDAWSNGGQVPFNGTHLNGYDGADGQAPDASFLAEAFYNPTFGWSGTVHATGTPMQLGSSPAIPSFSLQISGFLFGVGTGPGYPNDASLAQIIPDLLSNTRYGAGFPPANLDTSGTIADTQNYLQANQLAMSPILDRQRPCSDWVKSWLELVVCAAVWSGSVLKIIPYSTSAVSANGASWSPSTLTPIYTLNDDNFLPWEGNSRDNSSADPGNGPSDPVQVSINDPKTLTNWVSLEYFDVTNSYNTNVVPAFDQGAIDAYGLRPESSKEAHAFTNVTSAQIAANLYLQRKQAVRRTFKFKLGWRFGLLEPMDVVSITDPYVGVSSTSVRITSVEEDDNGELTFEAEELPGTAIAVSGTQSPNAQSLGLFANPGNANAPILFEAPASLTNGVPVLSIGTSGGTDWGGAQVWVSLDNTSFTALSGTIGNGLAQGVLTANLPSYAGANPDTTDTLAVDLTMSGQTLNSVTAGQASSGVSLCYVGGELLTFENAALTATSKYNLTTLYRGFDGTPISSHSTGAQFALVGITGNPGVFEYEYPSSLIGQTIFIKLLSFNQFGNELQDLASVTSYSYTLTGAGSVLSGSIPIDFNGIPQSGTPILNWTAGEAINFPANFVGSTDVAAVAATASTTFTVKKNGSSIGTLTFAASGTVGTFSGVSAFSLAIGDILSITPNRTDATLANITGALIGTT